MNLLVLEYERSVTRCCRRIRNRERTTVKQDSSEEAAVMPGRRWWCQA